MTHCGNTGQATWYNMDFIAQTFKGEVNSNVCQQPCTINLLHELHILLRSNNEVRKQEKKKKQNSLRVCSLNLLHCDGLAFSHTWVRLIFTGLHIPQWGCETTSRLYETLLIELLVMDVLFSQGDNNEKLHVFKCCEVRNKWHEVISLPHRDPKGMYQFSYFNAYTKFYCCLLMHVCISIEMSLDVYTNRWWWIISFCKPVIYTHFCFTITNLVQWFFS